MHDYLPFETSCEQLVQSHVRKNKIAYFAKIT